MTNKQHILVIGANGFIGSHLVDTLASDGHAVRAFGRFEKEPLFEQKSNVEIVKGDFLNQNDIKEALNNVSHVIHLVSTTTPATSDKDPLIDISTNVAGSVSLFQQCVSSSKVQRIIFASSGGTVYGDDYPGRPFTEKDLTNPISPYGIGKLSIENYLNYYHRSHGQDYTVFRISNPYGGRQKNTKQQGILPLLLNNIANGQPVLIYGDGTMVRDYINISDLVNIISKSIGIKLNYKTYNISSNIGMSINQLVKVVEEIVGKKAIIEHKESPATFVQTSILDNHLIMKEVPTELTDIRKGIQAMYQSYLAQSNP